MINFLKKLKNIISFEVQLVILGFMSLAFIYFAVDGENGVLNILRALLPALAILAAVWFLAIKKKFTLLIFFYYFLNLAEG